VIAFRNINSRENKAKNKFKGKLNDNKKIKKIFYY